MKEEVTKQNKGRKEGLKYPGGRRGTKEKKRYKVMGKRETKAERVGGINLMGEGAKRGTKCQENGSCRRSAFSRWD